MRDYIVGASIIYHPDYYVMHHRKAGIDNGETDKFGLYGGQFDDEKDETLLDTARRELGEESGIWIPSQGFRYEDYVFVKSERNGETVLVEADIYLVNLRDDIHEQFKDGVAMTPRELSRAKALGQLTSVASVALSKIKGI